MEIFINELPELLRNAFLLTVVITAVFYFVKIPVSWKQWKQEVLTKIILLIVSLAYTWLLIEVDPNQEISKQIWAYYILNVAFAVLFHEFAGKYFIKKFFRQYRGKEIIKQQ